MPEGREKSIIEMSKAELIDYTKFQGAKIAELVRENDTVRKERATFSKQAEDLRDKLRISEARALRLEGYVDRVRETEQPDDRRRGEDRRSYQY